MRIPSLDGLRAFSIAFVILGHIFGTGSPAILPAMGYLADFGVRVFFVISGLLITSLLLDEQRTHGRISLSRFFLRRSFRIFPAFFAFLGVLWVAREFGWVEVTNRDFAHAATYTSNYDPGRSWDVGHLWSLSVEEQFYLLWPALLVFGGIRKGMAGAAALIVAAPLVRLAYVHFFKGMEVATTFETAADSIAAGCLLAFYRDRLWAHEAWRERILSPAFIAAMFVLAYLLQLRTQLQMLAGLTVLNVAIALLVERCTRLPARDIGKVLNLPAVAYVGFLSYSLYLWQQPFLHHRGSVAIVLLMLLGTVVAAVASYYAVERPFLALRQRIEPKRATA